MGTDHKSPAEPVQKSPAEPVWHRPAWLTAIVGVISVFLTGPEVLGNYFAKQQDIEIAKQEVKAANLRNLQSQQDREFMIVQNTLAQQGTERVFVLRYFAATLDDEEAKQWAENEVQRLDELVSTKEERDRQKRELEQKQAELDALRPAGQQALALEAEIDELKNRLAEKDRQVTELRQKAGIGDADHFPTATWLSAIAVPVDAIIDNAPCPAETKMFVSVNHRFPRSAEQAKFYAWLDFDKFPKGSERNTLNIMRNCVDETGNIVGDEVVFGENGEMWVIHPGWWGGSFQAPEARGGVGDYQLDQ